MRYSKIASILISLILVLSLITSCGSDTGTDTTASDGGDVTAAPEADATEALTDAEGNIVTSAEEETTVSDTPTLTPETSTGTTTTDPETVVLTFNGLSCNPSADGYIEVKDNAFVITKAGTYELKGDLSDGQIRVQVNKGALEEVTLIFNGFTASSSTTAPLYIVSAEKTTIELAAGSVNALSDASLYQYATPGEDKPNACIYSSDDLTIKGDGTLTVTGNYNNGIGCKNDIRIRGGNVTVSAPNNILKGNDSITITGAKVTLSGGEDAIKTDNLTELDKGYILIDEGAQVTINCTDDALQADQSVTVGATAKVSGTCGGDVYNCPGVVNAAEGTVTVTSTAAPEA